MRVGITLPGALLALAAAGCGGGGGVHGYTLSATKSCLEKAGYTATKVANRYLPGAGGNLRVKVSNSVALLNPTAPTGTVRPNTYVYIVFAKDEAAAVKTENKADRLALASLSNSGLLMTRAGAKAGMQVTGNAFYYSDTGALTKTQRQKVSACLR
jgi:hypothetical protein